MNPKAKTILAAVSAVLAIAASGFWIYFGYFKAPPHDELLHRRIGEILAEETARLAPGKASVVYITIDSQGGPELDTQIAAFKQKLRQAGQYTLDDHVLETQGEPKYGLGTGISGRRFVRAVKRYEKADVIVSFVGVPKLGGDEIKELEGLTRLPKLVAETRSPDHLAAFFQKNWISVAIASRFTFPAPGPISPRTVEERFTKRYQIIRARDAAAIPTADGP